MAEKSGIQRQEVSTALELLIGKIEDERKRIYSDGANAMKALDADTASKVLDFAKKIGAFQGKVKQLNSDWSALVEEKVSAPQKVQDIVDGDGELFGMRTRKSKTGFTRNVTQPMAAKTNFRSGSRTGRLSSTAKLVTLWFKPSNALENTRCRD